jgi:hypothetical protein
VNVNVNVHRPPSTVHRRFAAIPLLLLAAACRNAPARFDRGAFCADVFSPADIAALLAVPALAPKPPPSTPPAGLAECELETRGPDDRVTASAKLHADCRGVSLDLEGHRRRAVATGDPGTLREVAVGRGGVYARHTVAQLVVVHMLTFVDDDAPWRRIASRRWRGMSRSG